MNKFLTIFVLIISGCSTKYYKPDEGLGGYSDKQLKKNEYLARYRGGSSTPIRFAADLSKLRSIEICKKNNFKYPKIFSFDDFTQYEIVQKSNSYTYQAPTNVSGNSNSSNTKGFMGNSTQQGTFNATISGGNQFTTGSTWNEKFIYPEFVNVFSCTNEDLRIGFEIRYVSPEDMKILVKDLLGAVQAMKQSTPEDKTELQEGDIIYKVNGERVTNLLSFSEKLFATKDKNSVELSIFREGVNKNINANLYDYSAITEVEQKNFVKNICDYFPETKYMCN